jgi:hypothetical protein
MSPNGDLQRLFLPSCLRGTSCEVWRTGQRGGRDLSLMPRSLQIGRDQNCRVPTGAKPNLEHLLFYPSGSCRFEASRGGAVVAVIAHAIQAPPFRAQTPASLGAAPKQAAYDARLSQSRKNAARERDGSQLTIINTGFFFGAGNLIECAGRCLGDWHARQVESRRGSARAVSVGGFGMRKTPVAAFLTGLLLTGLLLASSLLASSLLASSPALAFFDDSHYRGPPVYPVPYAYGYSYARARCGHYYAQPWIVGPCGSRVLRRTHRHQKRYAK